MDGHEKAVSFLSKKLKKNDILMTLGAGDVWKAGMRLLDSLKKETAGKKKK
jgi:UDP-N-acetylmuramate-alanine ligase